MSSTEHLSGSLMTPRANIAAQAPSITREPLLASQALNTEIASYNTTPKTYDDQVTVALGISSIVRKTLSYRSSVDRTELLNSENIADSEQTNCHGYVAVLSECLDQAKIDHCICFANGHSFVLLGDKGSKQYTMIDPVTRKYNGDITSALEGEDVFEQLANGAATATVNFHTDTMLNLRGLTARTSELAEKNRWISHENPRNLWRREQPADAYILRMKVLPAAKGREVLVHYTNAMVELNNKNSDGATEELVAIAGLYPDMDPRNRLELARNARTLAIEQGKWGNAMAIAKVIRDSVGTKDTVHGRYFMPDTLRKIGNLTNIDELLGYAIDDYAAIPGASSIKMAKIQKTREQYIRVAKSGNTTKA